MEKECCFRLSRRLWGDTKYGAPLRMPAWEARVRSANECNILNAVRAVPHKEMPL